MPSLSRVSKSLRGLFGASSDQTVSLVAKRFLLAFREHGIEPGQIPRLLPQVKLDNLHSADRLLAILTPDLLDQVAQLFGIRVQWLEGVDDRIYEYLATYKEPTRLLDHLRELWHQPYWANAVGCPSRILSTTTKLDYLSADHHLIVPILVEPIASLGEETIFRYHVYQDGFCWDHPPARIELKAIALVAYRSLHKPIPIYSVSPRDIDALLEGRRIPRALLGSCISTSPSLEDYILDLKQSAFAKETAELPDVYSYMADTGLDGYDFGPETYPPPVTLFVAQPAAEFAESLPPAEPKRSGVKQQAKQALWKQIDAAALVLWSQDPTRPIIDVTRQLLMIPEIKARAFQPDTIRKRIAKLAPEGIRGKPGRKPKKSA